MRRSRSPEKELQGEEPENEKKASIRLAKNYTQCSPMRIELSTQTEEETSGTALLDPRSPRSCRLLRPLLRLRLRLPAVPAAPPRFSGRDTDCFWEIVAQSMVCALRIFRHRRPQLARRVPCSWFLRLALGMVGTTGHN